MLCLLSVHQNREQIWSQMVWPWHDCWCLDFFQSSSEQFYRACALYSLRFLPFGLNNVFILWCFSVLLTLVVKIGCLSYHSLPVSSNISGHSSLTFLINRFLHNELLLTGFLSLFLLSFFSQFCLNSRESSVWKSQWVTSFWNTHTSPLSHWGRALRLNVNINQTVLKISWG